MQAQGYLNCLQFSEGVQQFIPIFDSFVHFQICFKETIDVPFYHVHSHGRTSPLDNQLTTIMIKWLMTWIKALLKNRKEAILARCF